jgi:pyruvate dehydrogenase E1 component
MREKPMPDFWEFPTVSMGLSPIMAIYQARFNHYLQDRGLKDGIDSKVWAFLGDGETDEPEALGAITLAAREQLDNLIFVINCNLQRLDGPVRGNGNIIQELEMKRNCTIFAPGLKCLSLMKIWPKRLFTGRRMTALN